MRFLSISKSCGNSKDANNIIENIDIGGPTMVRSAAKNFRNVAIITNKNDYNSIKELDKHKGKTSLKFRN